jgi:4-amino-4-deoxy-L-arabinose transferase-like glycosyltransferase
VNAGTKTGALRVKFLALWGALTLAKFLLAGWLPPFGDEAFYWQEGQHLAWAYSDLPGCTAWLIRLGVELGGDHPLAMRAPFLLLGATLPWLVRRIAARWQGDDAGWQAGLLAMLMPLSGMMGVLALPDVPMIFAALLCLDACAALMRRIEAPALVELAFALALGAFCHYRFALVILAGLAGLLMSNEGRTLLRQPRLWLVLAIGAAAWLPLALWNLAHAGAGVEFQLVQRNPWTFNATGGLLWLVQQLVAVTPVLFVLLLLTLTQAWKQRRSGPNGTAALVAGTAAVSVFGYFALAFFADRERVSFHWPVAGWLALVCASAATFQAWRPIWRWTLYAVSGVMLAGACAFLAVASVPAWRADLALSRWYPETFAGWPDVATAVREQLASMPADTRVVADNFMLGAQLGFALGQPDIAVLDHPLNHKHGRAAQLQQWRLQSRGRQDWGNAPVLLVVEDTVRPLKLRLLAYHELCRTTGGLPPPKVLNVDHGRKRFLLFALVDRNPGPACVAPALAWIDSPAIGGRSSTKLEVAGWAFKDGIGVAGVDVTVDGEKVASADYGAAEPKVADFWKISDDPQQPNVGFRKSIDLNGIAPGCHWLGLRIHGRDGSSEDWPEQPLRITGP